MELNVSEFVIAAITAAAVAVLLFAPGWLIDIPRARESLAGKRWVPMWLRRRI